MDRWKYFAIGHESHVFCNPFSEQKFDEIISLLDLPPSARVLDIACGKAELLLRVTERWDCEGVGVDLSPYCVEDARAKAAAAGLAERVRIVEANGADYRDAPGSFAAAFCIGASWIWGGHAPTLRALAEFVAPGGLVVVGEPFWRGEPSPEYLAAAGLAADSFASHRENVAAGPDVGLGILHAVVASADDWDRYEGLQWRAAERHARDNPQDPDLPELMSAIRRDRDNYLRWGREELGWAVYLFCKDPWTPT